MWLGFQARKEQLISVEWKWSGCEENYRSEPLGIAILLG